MIVSTTVRTQAIASATVEACLILRFKRTVNRRARFADTGTLVLAWISWASLDAFRLTYSAIARDLTEGGSMIWLILIAAREDFLKLKQIQIFIEHLKLKPKQIQTGPLSEL